MTPNVTWNNNTPYSTQFSDTYYNPDNGLAEAEYVFLHQNGLPGAWRNADQYTIGELGFGTGLNFCLTWRQWNSSAKLPHARLNYLSFEQYPLSKRQISRALSTWQDLAPYRDLSLIHI